MEEVSTPNSNLVNYITKSPKIVIGIIIILVLIIIFLIVQKYDLLPNFLKNKSGNDDDSDSDSDSDNNSNDIDELVKTINKKQKQH